MKLDPIQHTADGVRLTRREYQLLSYFVSRKNKVLTSQEIAVAVWGNSVQSNLLTIYVKALRQKFGVGRIDTVYGVGYRWVS